MANNSWTQDDNIIRRHSSGQEEASDLKAEEALSKELEAIEEQAEQIHNKEHRIFTKDSGTHMQTNTQQNNDSKNTIITSVEKKVSADASVPVMPFGQEEIKNSDEELKAADRIEPDAKESQAEGQSAPEDNKTKPEASEQEKAQPQEKSVKSENIQTQVSNVTAVPATDPIFELLKHEVGSLRRTTSFLFIFIILLLIGIGFGGYYFYQHPDLFKLNAAGKPLTAEEIAAQSEQNFKLLKAQDDIATLKADISALKTDKAEQKELDSKAGSLENSLSSLNEQFGKQAENLKTLNQELKQFETRNPNDWRVAQAYFLVNNAFQIVMFSDDISSAVWCLKDADNLLVNLSEPNILKIREAIHSDVMKLSNLPTIDKSGISLKLDSVYRNLDSMQINEIGALNKGSPVINTDDSATDWKANLLESFKKFSSRFIEIRHRQSNDVDGFLSSKQITLVKQNIQSELLLAKFALFHSNYETYSSSISQAVSLIETYYDHDTNSYKANIETLNNLLAQKFDKNVTTSLQSQLLFTEFVKSQPTLHDSAVQLKDDKKSTETNVKETTEKQESAKNNTNTEVKK
ncbi:MAG: uroporphyrinogen-III C-methyltransferase [Succinivibrio sp.]|nr:uroporphyrinogen-III C-methyltransferase [Succinivibrio sp.]